MEREHRALDPYHIGPYTEDLAVVHRKRSHHIGRQDKQQRAENDADAQPDQRREPERVSHPLVILCAVAVTRDGLEALSEAHDHGAHEHHYAVGHRHRGQRRVAVASGVFVGDHRRHAHQAGAQERGQAHPGHLAVDRRFGREQFGRDTNQRLPPQERGEQYHKAHHLGERRGRRRSGHPPVESKNEQRVQQQIHDAARNHADHGIGGAPLRAQRLAEADLAGGEGYGKEDKGSVLDRVRPDIFRGAQEHDQ